MASTNGASRRLPPLNAAALRALLIEMAWMWVRYQPQSELAQWYFKRISGTGTNKRHKRIAIVAVARRLAASGARVPRITSDEFGTLAKGFNGMAEHLQSMYRNLEDKVAEKTSELQEKRERLEALYDVTTLAAKVATALIAS